MSPMLVDLTDVGKKWIEENYPPGIVYEYDVDKPFGLRSLGVDTVELTFTGAPYVLPHTVEGKRTFKKHSVRTPTNSKGERT